MDVEAGKVGRSRFQQGTAVGAELPGAAEGGAEVPPRDVAWLLKGCHDCMIGPGLIYLKVKRP